MVKLRTFLIVSLCCAAAASAGLAQNVYNLPQVANGGGLIRTTFIGFNNGDTAATVVLTLRRDDGSPLALELSGLGTDSTHVFMLQPGETRFLETTGQGAVQAGSAQAISTAPIGFSGVFSLLRAGGGTLTEAGVGASQGLTEFVIAVDSTGVFNTGIALQNLSGGDNQVTFTLFETQPAGSATPRGGAPQTTRTLEGDGHLSVFFSGAGGLFPNAGSTRGLLRIQAQSEVAALTLRQGRSGSPLTTLPVVSTASDQTSFVLPQVANGTGIRTQFILFGLGGAGAAGGGGANVNIALTDSGGAAFPVTLSNGESGSSFDLTVGGTEAVFLETDGAGALRAGAARVTSDQPIGLTAAFSLLNAQGQITTEAGIGASPAEDEFSLPVDLTSGFDTGLALFNPGNSTANLTLQFIAEDGSTAGAEFPLGARATASIEPQGAGLSLAPLNQLARFVSQLIMGLGEVRGQLAVTSDRPVNALTLRQGSTTLTTLPVQPGVGGGGPGPGPMGSELVRSVEPGIDGRADVTVDRVLDGGFRLSGTVTVPMGFFPTSVIAIESGGEVYGGSVDFFGNYLIIVPAGTYDVRVCAAGAALPAAAAPAGAGGTSVLFVGASANDVAVSADTVQNVTVGAVTTRNVSGTLSGMASLPGDTTTSLLFADEDNFRSVIATVAGDGTYTASVPTGTYEVVLFFASGEDTDFDGFPDDLDSAGAFRGVGQLTVGGGAVTANFSVPNSSEVSGRVTQPQTPVIPEQTGVLAADVLNPVTSFLEQCFPAVGASFGLADGNGDYSLLVASNRNYDLFANLPIVAVGTEEQGVWSLPIPGAGNRNFPGDTTVDFPYPARPGLVTARGRVTDRSGAPVAGVDVTFSTSGGVTGAANTAFTASTTTGADGRYELELLSGTNYLAVFDPPPPTM